MIVLNFSHPLTPIQMERLAQLVGQPIERVVSVPGHFDEAKPFASQVTELVSRCGLSEGEWQTMPLVVIPPALNFIAVTLLAELHGRMGYFPTCARMRPVEGSMPLRYEVAEVLDLQAIRTQARQRRSISV